jgi:hypothetical protein
MTDDYFPLPIRELWCESEKMDRLFMLVEHDGQKFYRCPKCNHEYPLVLKMRQVNGKEVK